VAASCVEHVAFEHQVSEGCGSCLKLYDNSMNVKGDLTMYDKYGIWNEILKLWDLSIECWALAGPGMDVKGT
jgi:hypothetical protein